MVHVVAVAAIAAVGYRLVAFVWFVGVKGPY
jgi:hypothetical protein